MSLHDRFTVNKTPDGNSRRSTLLSVLNIINSLVWFCMDALWLFNYKTLPSICMIIMLTTGAYLCFKGKVLSEVCADTALFLWMWMNSLWMLSDLYNAPHFLFYAKLFFPAGLVFIIISIITNKSVSSIGKHFSRFRGLSSKKD